MDIGKIVEALQCTRKTGSNTYQALCPAHDDKKQSLTITDAGDKILMHCHAGCDVKDILKKLGLKESDLFNNEGSNYMSTIDKEYLYTDEENRILYKVIRFFPKRFQQAKWENGKWHNNMENVKRVPYNLPNILKSEEIYFVEGEKDADNLNDIGLTATTTVGGALGFVKYQKEYMKYFKNKAIYIVPDNDDAGQKYAKNIYNTLSKITHRIKILNLKDELPDLKEKSDISDVISQYGKNKTLEILENLKSTDNLFEFSGQVISKELLENILTSLNIKVGYNEITKDIDVEGLPKEYSKENSETILPIFLKELLNKYKIKGNKKDIEDLLILIFDSHRYNPIIDMFKNNEWDKKDRFNTLFEIMNITDEFEKILIRKWFWQTVSIAFNGYIGKPYGIAGVLTLQGSQNSGKTRFCRNISLNTDWFTEGASINMKDKDSKILASKGWIVELGEADSTTKKKQSDIKAFLSNTMDDIRVPYGRKSIKKPRRTSFCATVNPVDFLTDDTR